MSPVLALVGFVGLCLLVAAADGSIVAGAARGWYLSLNRPPGTPPNWVFAAVWTALYAMIGLAGWLVWRRTVGTRAFFALHSPPLAFAICLVLLGLIALTLRAFLPLRPAAAWLMAPYLAWTGYVTYLTAGFWWLNPS